MRLNKEARKVCRQLFRTSFTNGKLDSGKAAALVQSIVETKPRHYLDILKDYQRLIRLEVERGHAVVESSAPLAPENAAKVQADLQSKFGADLTTEFKVTPELLGGLRIKIGSDVWDGSVRNRIERLNQQLNQV
jgi:F-type H+-transporting ATPase subunit delta